MRICHMFLAACLVLASACTQTPDKPSGASLTKDEVRAMDGKSDSGVDLCWYFDWYEDGVCDEFCPEPDPDCSEDTDGGMPPIDAAEPFRCRSQSDCAASEVCDFPLEGGWCGLAGAEGVCIARMGDCGMVEGPPVCGCDGANYASACLAREAGTSVMHEGACDCRDMGCEMGRYCTWCWREWACIPDGALC